MIHIPKNLLVYFSTTNMMCDFKLVKCFVILQGLLFSSLIIFIMMSKNRNYLVSLCFTKVCYILYSTCYKCTIIDDANMVLPKLTNHFVYTTGYRIGKFFFFFLYKIILFLTHVFQIKRHFDFYKSYFLLSSVPSFMKKIIHTTNWVQQ
jgi:hypothetical protein